MPEGLSNPASTDTWQVTSSEVELRRRADDIRREACRWPSGMAGTYAQGTWSALLYQAPADVTINGGTIYRAEHAEGTNNGFMGIIQQGGEPSVLYSLPRNGVDQGDWFAGNVASRGTFAWPFSPENLVNLTISPDGGHWDVNATCDPNGNNNSSCTLSAGQWEYRIFGGEISLYAARRPAGEQHHRPADQRQPCSRQRADHVLGHRPGTRPRLRENARRRQRHAVADHRQQRRTLRPSGRRAIPTRGPTRCRARPRSAGAPTALNTTELPNGTTTSRCVIEDAAGNQSIVLDRTVNVENAALGALASLPGPSGGAGAPEPIASVANGAGASEYGQLQLDGPTTLLRSFAQRSVRLTGRLLNRQGQPITGASLDILEQLAPGSQAQVIAHTGTATNGAFTANVPPGPTRLLTVAYRAFSSDASYSAMTQVQEAVAAGVQMHITPRAIAPTGRIVLAGRVAGPIPRHGVLVELLVHYRGHWEPFRDPRTDASGHFEQSYQFEGAVGRFPFRAQVLAGQAGFPYAAGESAPIAVDTG